MKIKLSSSLIARAGGQAEFEVDAGTINQILDRLSKLHPGLAEMIEEGVSVAVDDAIVSGDFSRVVAPTSEVFILNKIVGG